MEERRGGERRGEIEGGKEGVRGRGERRGEREGGKKG